ncbi:MAG TPA: prepilin peptidase [Candidatus Anoxymicrobiaceae bacterium]
MQALATLLPLCLFLVLAVVADLKLRRIPNVVNLAGFAGGICFACARSGAAGLTASLLGSLLGLSILLVPFLLHMVGGGDVKFLAAAGAIVGYQSLWWSFVLGAFLGGLFALAALLKRHRSLSGAHRALVLLVSGAWRIPADAPPSQVVRIPYAVPLSIGLLIATGFLTLARGA